MKRKLINNIKIKINDSILLFILLLFFFINIYFFYRNREFLSVLFFIINLILIFLSLLSIICLNSKYFNIIKKLNILFIIIYVVYLIFIHYNIFDINLKLIIKNTGKFGCVIFILFNALQVLIIPIPSAVSVITGVCIYGENITFILTSIGIIFGSFLAFFLGRAIGEKFLKKYYPNFKYSNYLKILNQKNGLYLFLMLILPLFPDDIICVLAGLSSLSIKKYAIIQIIARLISIGFLSYFSTGNIIPFKNWGIFIWLVIALIVICIVIKIYKNIKE